MKFNGTIDNLKQHLLEKGFNVTKEDKTENKICLRLQGGEIVNFWPTTGTINIQGKLNETLRNFINDLCNSNSATSTPVTSQLQTNQHTTEKIVPATVETQGKVFVVHGHDEMAREQLELVLHKLGIEHFVLQNTSGNGLTIIEALEQQIGAAPTELKIWIVLLNPDDMGYAIKSPDKVQPRARQNVVLEMGMLLSSIGRKHVAILKKGDLEIPSDANGILYIDFNHHVKETVSRLVERLTESGFKINPENIIKASS